MTASSLIEVARLYDSGNGSSKYSFAIVLEVYDAALYSNLSQVVNKNMPPGLKTRYASANAFGLSGTNIYPKQQTTRSILLSLNGSCCASIFCHSILRWLNLFFASLNISSLISEAINF